MWAGSALRAGGGERDAIVCFGPTRKALYTTLLLAPWISVCVMSINVNKVYCKISTSNTVNHVFLSYLFAVFFRGLCSFLMSELTRPRLCFVF